MAKLFPESYQTESMAEAINDSKKIVGYKPSAYFSMETGDFVRNGQNKVQEATGYEAWEQWCQKCLMTERYKHFAYSTDYGIELDQVFAAESREEAENILTRQITEALEADPYGRTKNVANIEYEWDNQTGVNVYVTVIGIDHATLDMTVYLKMGER